MKAFRDKVIVIPRPDYENDRGIITDFSGKYNLRGKSKEIGFVEVEDVGPGCPYPGNGDDMPKVKPGDICIIDFNDVLRKVTEHGVEKYIMNGDYMIAKYNGPKKAPTPLCGFALTKRVEKRCQDAMYGKKEHIQKTNDFFEEGVYSDQNQAMFAKFSELKTTALVKNRDLVTRKNAPDRTPEINAAFRYGIKTGKFVNCFGDPSNPLPITSVYQDSVASHDSAKLGSPAHRYIYEELVSFGPGAYIYNEHKLGTSMVKGNLLYKITLPKELKGKLVVIATTRSYNIKIGQGRYTKHYKLTPMKEIWGEVEE